VCGIPTAWDFDDQTTAKKTVSIASNALTSYNKCTYVVTALKDAPGFEILDSTMTGVSLYYVELNDPTLLGGLYSSKSYPDPTNNLNYVFNHIWDQSLFMGGELTSYSQRRNAFDESIAHYIQVPVDTVNNQIAQYQQLYDKF